MRRSDTETLEICHPSSRRNRLARLRTTERQFAIRSFQIYRKREKSRNIAININYKTRTRHYFSFLEGKEEPGNASYYVERTECGCQANSSCFFPLGNDLIVPQTFSKQRKAMREQGDRRAIIKSTAKSL